MAGTQGLRGALGEGMPRLRKARKEPCREGPGLSLNRASRISWP